MIGSQLCGNIKKGRIEERWLDQLRMTFNSVGRSGGLKREGNEREIVKSEYQK